MISFELRWFYPFAISYAIFVDQILANTRIIYNKKYNKQMGCDKYLSFQNVDLFFLCSKPTIRYPFRYPKPVSIFDIQRCWNVFQIIIATDLADAKVIGSRKCHPLFIWFSIQTIRTFGGIIKSIICHILSIVSQG